MSGNQDGIVRYRIDAGSSRFTVQAFAEGLLSAFGHDPVIAVCGFGGDVRLAPDTLEHASLLLIVRADSLATVGDMSEKDRREIERAVREDVLEAARHPEIVYMSTRATVRRASGAEFHVSVVGDLSLHGVTRTQQIDARVTLGDNDLHARGDLSLRQSAFNIKPVSVAVGALKVKDEVRLSFDISAIAQR